MGIERIELFVTRAPDGGVGLARAMIRGLLGFLAPVLGLSLQIAVVAETSAATNNVDLQLVLAVDSSGSIDDNEFILQRWGYANAFRNPRVIAAIRSGVHRAIAVTYIEWSGPGIQVTIADWTLIKDAATANRFADKLESVPRAMISGNGTAVGEAILMAAGHFDDNDFNSPRRVIDISGDGPVTRGRPASWARDLVVARGITINGLPVIDRRYPDLELFFLDHVIGGPGAFAIPAYGFKDIAAAVLSKLIREIAGGTPSSDVALQ
ncbi:MAG: DUF1194 domain-containing protein [Proteobacteria bacterium]|nr:DUF1194 domain-containing protein [Pseudomonadota bacterium]